METTRKERERGKRNEWCMEHDIVIMNTMFGHHPMHLHTRKSQGDYGKAFDMVKHDVFIKMPENIGIGEK